MQFQIDLLDDYAWKYSVQLRFLLWWEPDRICREWNNL